MKFKRSYSLFRLTKTQKRVLLFYFFCSIFSGPIGIILHEGGHYIGAKISGYTNYSLHYASFSIGKSPVDIVNYKREIISAGGPLVTIILSLVCCVGAYIYRFKIFFITMGLLTSLRNLSSLIIIITYAFGGKMRNSDEVKLATFLDIPALIPLTVSFLVFIGVWVFLIRQIDRLNRKKILITIILGEVIGLFLWINIIGPWVLP